MRTIISLLVTTFLFGSLALDCQNNLRSDASEMMTASRTRSGNKPKQPEKPIPHRGSGRRELMEYFVSTSTAV
jgi:hypothetical protein